MKLSVNISAYRCFALLCVAFLLCGCYKDTSLQEELNEYKDRLEILEDVYIRDLDTQISSINASLSTLSSVRENLDRMVAQLESKLATIQSQIEEGALDVTQLESEFSSLQSMIESLKQSYSNISSEMTSLHTYVDEELKKMSDWAYASFVTMTKYSRMQDELSSLRARLESYLKTCENHDEEFDRIESHLDSSIAESEKSMMTWVNETLADNFYDIATIDGKIDVLKSLISSEDSLNEELLNDLDQQLDSAKVELVKASQKAIEDAIENNNGVLSDENYMGELQRKLDDKLPGITEDLEKLWSDLVGLDNRLNSIEEQVDTINISILQLEKVDSLLQPEVDALRERVAEMREKFNNHVGVETEELKTLEQKCNRIEGILGDLQEESSELDAAIEDLREYLNRELIESKDLAKSSYATLEQYDNLQTVLSRIKNLMSEDIDVDELVRDEINTAEETMKAWVNKTLADNYYDIAEIDAMFTSLTRDFKSKDDSLQDDFEEEIQEQLEAFEKSIVNARKEMSTKMKEAIEEAVKTNNNDLLDSVAAEIQRLLQNKLDELNGLIKNLDKDISSLNERITTVEEQADAIRSSIDSLELVHVAFNERIVLLEGQLSQLREQLESYSSTEVSERLKLQEDIDSLCEELAKLMEQDERLEGLIARLEDDVAEKLQSLDGWLNETFATLESYGAMAAELQKIKEYLNGNADETIASAVSKCEESLKGWVSDRIEKLVQEVVEMDAAISALDSLSSVSDQALQQQAAALREDFNDKLSSLNEEFAAALKEAILENNGVLEPEVSDMIESYKTKFADSLAAVNSQLLEIENELNIIKEQMSKVLSMIQSVTYIPRHSNGVVYVDESDKYAYMMFRLSPESSVEPLSHMWENVLSVQYVNMSETTSSAEIGNLPILKATFDCDSGLVSVKIDCSDLKQTFYSSSVPASAALLVSDEVNFILSDFIPLVPGDVDDALFEL